MAHNDTRFPLEGPANTDVVRTPAGAEVGLQSQALFRGNVVDVIESLRSGKVGASIIAELADRTGVTQERLLEALRLPDASLTTRIATNADLAPAELDRLYRVEKVLERANIVFEDRAAVQAWMSSCIRSLGGVTPLSLLDTEAGYELVLDTLGRIEYGVMS